MKFKYLFKKKKHNLLILLLILYHIISYYYYLKLLKDIENSVNKLFYLYLYL